MLEEIFEDDLIGDPNDLEEIIEQQAEENEDDPEAQEVGANAENNDNENENANAGGTRVDPKKKRTVRNPQPKLNPERLKGPRGIAVLEKTFEDFKFHGKGYERVDLNRVMKRLEHWAHRLFPRFQFDDCLDKIEKLGQKKPVQVYVKKIRMGLETGEEPVILCNEDDEDEQNDSLQGPYDAPIDAFDELIAQQLSQVQSSQPNISTAPAVTPLQAALSSSSFQPKPPELTAEQKERILRNRLLAEERKLARMKTKREMEKAAQEPSTSILNRNLTDNQICNNISHSSIVDILNQEPSTSTSSVVKELSVNSKISESQDIIYSSERSHKDKTYLPPVTTEENESTLLLEIVEQCSTVSTPDDIKENNHTLNSSQAEIIKLVHIPDDIEQNKLMPVLPENEQSEYRPTSKLAHSKGNVESDTSEQNSFIAMAVDSEPNNLTSASFDIKQNNSSFNLDNGRNNLISGSNFTIENSSIPMSIDGEQNDPSTVLSNEEKNTNFKLFINDLQNKSHFLSVDKNQSKTISISIDADQNNSNSMLVDNEQDKISKFIENSQKNVISMLVDNNESTCMSVDAEQNSPTSMSVDNEQSNSIPMSVDNEQSNPAPNTLENEQNNLTCALKDEHNINNKQSSEEENVISNVLQRNKKIALDISEEM